MIALMAMIAVFASAQNAAAPATTAVFEPRQISEEAMKFVADNDMKGLFEHIGRHMPIEKKELEATRLNFIEQRKQLNGTIGKGVGYAFIGECRKSDLLVRLTYVEKREKSVVRWLFIFYKARNTWQITNFFMDQDMNAVFLSCT
jgi:hypothetical protein